MTENCLGYGLAKTPIAKNAETKIYQIIPAAPETFVVVPDCDAPPLPIPVIAWGVMEELLLVPLTINGAWNDSWAHPCFVLYPDGTCGNHWRCWKSVDEAVAALVGRLNESEQRKIPRRKKPSSKN